MCFWGITLAWALTPRDCILLQRQFFYIYGLEALAGQNYHPTANI